MKKVFTLLLLGCSMSLFSQDLEVKLPTVVPPSPEAASLGKYGDIPVGYYTGVPNINVPIHTVQVRDLTVPIQMSYHASGVKVEEEAGWTGLGWSLMAGGVITRSIRGNDDLRNTSDGRTGYVYSHPFEKVYELNINEARSLCYGGIDGQPDIFYFNFAGYSGKFFLKKKEHHDDPIEAVLLSNSAKINIDLNEETRQWTVLTPDGSRYIFGTREYVKSFGGPIPNPFIADKDILIGSWDDSNAEAITSWYLDEIYSPLGERATFHYDVDEETGRSKYVSRSVVSRTDTRTEYVGVGQVTRENENRPYELDESTGLCSIYFKEPRGFHPFRLRGLKEQITPNCTSDASFSGSVSLTSHVYLKSIEFANGLIEFETSERHDLLTYNRPGRSDNLPPRKLDKIIISNGDSKRTFLLEYAYFNGNRNSDGYLYKRLKLQKITETAVGESKNPYEFSYIGDNSVSSATLPAKNSYGRDHWGFYNGVESNQTAGRGRQPTLVPGFQYLQCASNLVNVPGANREPVESRMKNGVLKRITYPTGGYTEFEYEIHDYTSQESEVVETPFFDVLNGSDSKTIVISDTTSISITAHIKCNTLDCRQGSGTQESACTEQQLFPHLSKPYFSIARQGGEVTKFLYGDYYCKLDPKFCATQNVDEANRCGISKTKTLTLYPGTYVLRTYNEGGFSADANYRYSQYDIVDAGKLEKKGGGLRVSKITDHDGIYPTRNVVRKFQYTTKDEDGVLRSSGKLMTIPNYLYPMTGFQSFNGNTDAFVCFFLKAFSYSNRPLGTSAQGSNVGYDKVTVLYGENGENGRAVYEYMNDPDDLNYGPYGIRNRNIPNIPLITHAASNGQLLKEIIYTSSGFKVKETENKYEIRQSQTHLIEAVGFFTVDGCENDIAWYHYHEPSEWWTLTETTEKVYDTSDPSNERYFSTNTSYQYLNTEHRQPTSVRNALSNGRVRLTRIYYPLDLKSLAPPEMWDEGSEGYKNMNALPIKQEVYELIGETEEIRFGTQNNYSFIPPAGDSPQNGRVLLSSVDKAKVGGEYEPRLIFSKYDGKGNPLEVSRTDDSPVAYLWGYGQTLPVAEIRNAHASEVFYTSFEDDGLEDAEAKSGEKSHAGAYTFNPPSDFSPQQNSVLSYWFWESGKWHYKEKPYSGGSVVINDGSKIDELRIHPFAAQMTTFCYQPHVGIVTATDMRGQATHYEYDKLNRLEFLKDLNGDIVKYFDYQYKKKVSR